MAEHSNPEKKKGKAPAEGFPHTLYVPEDQLFERIPLCRYLGDLSELFETDEPADRAVNDEEKGEGS
ncbi:MAG: hypothetical protein RBR16_08305 [Syntrophus sp. (in: bacteria)]|nr:hypothetical protein [Syntrophus sp. (in: bacteria)]